MSTDTDLESKVDAVRRFNRFYTRQIGLLQERIYQSRFSLTEVRVLYELAHRSDLTASHLTKELGLDAGYLSRLLARFEKTGYLRRTRSQSDARQSHLSLTRKGGQAFAPLNQRSHQEIAALLSRLSASDQKRMAMAMQTIEKLLTAQSTENKSYLLRPHQPGDMGWVVHRHGVLYSQEYGYDERFEALVAEICAKFIAHFDPARERCWIAEVDGEIAGSVFLVKKSRTIAQLRMLLVEPWARGMGIGKRLVAECVRFARQAGYKKVVLWTQSELHAARHLYEEASFRKVEQERHQSWSRENLVSETWELKL